MPKALQLWTLGQPFLPFLGDNRPEFCGHEGFRLSHCQDQQGPIITSFDQDFRVIHVNQTLNTMNIARRDLYDYVCPAILDNIAFHKTLFRFVPELGNLSLAYNCTTSPFTITTALNCSHTIDGAQIRVFYGSEQLWRQNDLVDIGQLCDRVEMPVLLDTEALEEIIWWYDTDRNGLKEVREVLRNEFSISYDYHEDISPARNARLRVGFVAPT